MAGLLVYAYIVLPVVLPVEVLPLGAAGSAAAGTVALPVELARIHHETYYIEQTMCVGLGLAMGSAQSTLYL